MSNELTGYTREHCESEIKVFTFLLECAKKDNASEGYTNYLEASLARFQRHLEYFNEKPVEEVVPGEGQD